MRIARLPLPSSNRTCGFPASGFHANSRGRAVRRPQSRLSSAAKPRSKMRTVPQPCGWFSVGGLSSKRNSHPLTQHVCVPAPSLHGRYPLLRYYGPVRLPVGAASRVMSSPSALASATPSGLPGSPTDLSPRAVPFHPGKPSGCLCSLLRHWCQASSDPEDWPLSLRANGAVSGSLALRLAGSPSRASPVELLRPTPGRLPVE